MSHGNPSPRKTFTEFEPVTLPIAESAVSAFLAAVIDANVSGKEVPRATNVMAVTESSIPHTHPNISAAYPTITVIPPMYARETTNAGHPPPLLIGGTVANNNFQKIVTKCVSASLNSTVSTSILSVASIVGPSKMAVLNYSHHVGSCLLRKNSSIFW
jgi:hypothetical protein